MFIELSDEMVEGVVGGAMQGTDVDRAVKDVCVELIGQITAVEEALNAGLVITQPIHAADVFPDTTARIRKSGGTMFITFDTTDLQSAQALSEHMAEMRSRLMETLKHTDYIEMSINFM